MAEFSDFYSDGERAFRNGGWLVHPTQSREYLVEQAGFINALADAVRDLATAVRLLSGEEADVDVDVPALRERLAQIKPRDG